MWRRKQTSIPQQRAPRLNTLSAGDMSRFFLKSNEGRLAGISSPLLFSDEGRLVELMYLFPLPEEDCPKCRTMGEAHAMHATTWLYITSDTRTGKQESYRATFLPATSLHDCFAVR